MPALDVKKAPAGAVVFSSGKTAYLCARGAGMVLDSCAIQGSVILRMARSLARICLIRSNLRARGEPDKAGTAPTRVALAALAH